MSISKRQKAIESCKIAGYHNDVKTLTRVYVENRISQETAWEAFRKGKKMKENGVKCSCSECNK